MDDTSDEMVYAIRKYRNADYSTAITKFQKILSYNSSDKISWHYLGLSYRKIGKIEKSLICFDKVIYLDKSYSPAWVAKGNVFLYYGLLRKASDCYDIALYYDRNNHEIWRNKARVFSLLGLKKEERSCYKAISDLTGIHHKKLSDLQNNSNLSPINMPLKLQFSYVVRGIEGFLYQSIQEKIVCRCIKFKKMWPPGNLNNFFYQLAEDAWKVSHLEDLIANIQDVRITNEGDDARIIINMVQQIPYHSVYRDNYRIFAPYEVIYHQRGMCADKSILTSLLLAKMGYGSALFLFKTHMAAGIQVPKGYGSYGTNFCFIETTYPSIPSITAGQHEYGDSGKPITSKPELIPISYGKPLNSITEEIEDAKKWLGIKAAGLNLSYEMNLERNGLINKYGMRCNILPDVF